MISIIICSITPTKFNNITRNYTELMGDEPFEIIGIHDAKSLCEGYNRGIKKSVGDILVFSHDDVEILSPDFVARLKAHLENFDIVGLAGTDKVVGGGWMNAGVPHLYGQVANPQGAGYQVALFDYGKTAKQGKTAAEEIKMLDGLFFATRRSVVQQVAFDELNFDGFHGYDVDFTYSAFRAGFHLAVCNDIAVIHYSGGSFDSVFQKYKRRFAIKHRLTMDVAEPKAARPAPTFATINCANKEGVLNSFSPVLQRHVYEQFVVIFPQLISATVGSGVSRLQKQAWRFIRLIAQRTKLFVLNIL
jgi:hypothetical protein